MSEDYPYSLLIYLPEQQRAAARRRITWMVRHGWQNIGLWTADEPADITDLVGVPQDGPRKGQVTFLSAGSTRGIP